MSRADLMQAPARLSASALEIWKSIAVEALKDGRLTEASKDTFAVYCEVKAIADALDEVMKAVPADFVDPHGEEIVHPLQVVLADVREAEIELGDALGLGPARLEERAGELGSLRDARFNRVDPRDLWNMFGPRTEGGGGGMEATGELPQLDTRVGQDGEGQEVGDSDRQAALRVQLSELNKRSHIYSQRFWQIPVVFLTASGVLLGLGDELSLSQAWSFGLLFVLGAVLTWHMWAMVDGTERAVSAIRRIEEELALPLTAEWKPGLYIFPYALLVLAWTVLMLGQWILALRSG